MKDVREGKKIMNDGKRNLMRHEYMNVIRLTEMIVKMKTHLHKNE